MFATTVGSTSASPLSRINADRKLGRNLQAFLEHRCNLQPFEAHEITARVRCLFDLAIARAVSRSSDLLANRQQERFRLHRRGVSRSHAEEQRAATQANTIRSRYGRGATPSGRTAALASEIRTRPSTMTRSMSRENAVHDIVAHCPLEQSTVVVMVVGRHVTKQLLRNHRLERDADRAESLLVIPENRETPSKPNNTHGGLWQHRADCLEHTDPRRSACRA